MSEHFLLKNLETLPKEAILRSNKVSKNLAYLTKSAAAPGDDDDYDSAMHLINGWSTFCEQNKKFSLEDESKHKLG
jgi:hypothetical protein